MINELPLMTRRQENHKEDPMQELLEIYTEVASIESHLKKTINIGKFMVEKNRELLNATIELQEESEILVDEFNSKELQCQQN
jgi:hypothetical protein